MSLEPVGVVRVIVKHRRHTPIFFDRALVAPGKNLMNGKGHYKYINDQRQYLRLWWRKKGADVTLPPHGAPHLKVTCLDAAGIERTV